MTSMAHIADRAAEYRLHCFASPETMPHIMKRITRLARSGRRMVIVRRYISNGDAAPDVYVGLTLDTDARGGGVNGWSQSEPEGSGVSVMCKPGIVDWGVSAYESDGDEEEMRKRWHGVDGRQRREVTFVEIEGGSERNGFGRNDMVNITRYNENGVGIQIIVRFDTPDAHEEYSAEADTVDRVAAAVDAIEADPLGRPIDGDLLRQLAGRVRYMYEPVEKVNPSGPAIDKNGAPL